MVLVVHHILMISFLIDWNVNNVATNMLLQPWLHTAAVSREAEEAVHGALRSHSRPRWTHGEAKHSCRPLWIIWMLCGRYRSGNFGGCIVMRAVQQRVLLLRHCLEGGRNCIFRRERAYSLNKQRQALCLRMLWLLWPSYFYAVREREEGRRTFFFWVKHCASSLSSLQVDRTLQVLGTLSA